MKIVLHGFLLLVSLVATPLALAQSQSSDHSPSAHGPLDKMPTDLEVTFALSALPMSLRAGATVYVLDPAKGYVLARNGNNGQSCFVGRTEWKFGDYRNDIYDPICFDAVGAKNHMRVWFDVAEFRASGMNPEAMKKEIETRFRNGTYRPPDHAGFSYMTSPLMRTYMSLDPSVVDSVATMSMPHIMHYAPNIVAEDVGAIPCPPCAPYPFVFEPGPHGYIIQRLGADESEKIVADEKTLIEKLCAYRSVLCLTKGDPDHSSSSH